MSPFDLAMSAVLLCCRHRGSITSWGRSVQHNKFVGGVGNSWHLLWLGIDVVLDEMKHNPEFEADAVRLGLKPIFEMDHYHLQPL